MKRLLIGYTYLFLLLTSCSASKIFTNEGIQIKLPKSANQLSKEQLPADLKLYASANICYDVGGIFVSLSKNTGEMFKNKTLEKNLRSMSLLLKDTYKIESSKIEVYNGKRFIVITYPDYRPGANSSIYDFLNDTERNSTVIHGIIRYNKANQQKEADKLLKMVLSSLSAD